MNAPHRKMLVSMLAAGMTWLLLALSNYSLYLYSTRNIDPAATVDHGILLRRSAFGLGASWDASRFTAWLPVVLILCAAVLPWLSRGHLRFAAWALGATFLLSILSMVPIFDPRNMPYYFQIGLRLLILSVVLLSLAWALRERPVETSRPSGATP